MIRYDALVVGGGPGGSTCARVLRRAGWTVAVADRARFPRDKVCAGWLTPDVFRLLELDPAEYRATGLTLQEIRGFRTGVLGSTQVATRYGQVVSYAIRRCEFDAFLLRRAGVTVHEGMSIGSLVRRGGVWIVNDAIETPVVIGAGGHFCPVARFMRGAGGEAPPVVAKEAECRLAGRTTSTAGDSPELFFCRDFEGYGWCVRKGDYVNVGIGRRLSRDFTAHVRQFTEFLERTGRLTGASQVKWRGHAYLASGVGPRRVAGDGLLLVGDAAGLAYPESGEGIKPAIESGRLAGEILARTNGATDAAALRAYVEAIAERYPAAGGGRGVMRGLAAAAGRVLMRSPAFTRHVVLDRWFLRLGHT